MAYIVDYYNERQMSLKLQYEIQDEITLKKIPNTYVVKHNEEFYEAFLYSKNETSSRIDLVYEFAQNQNYFTDTLFVSFSIIK